MTKPTRSKDIGVGLKDRQVKGQDCGRLGCADGTDTVLPGCGVRADRRGGCARTTAGPAVTHFREARRVTRVDVRTRTRHPCQTLRRSDRASRNGQGAS